MIDQGGSEDDVMAKIRDFVSDEIGQQHIDKAIDIFKQAIENKEGEMTFDDMINQLKGKKEDDGDERAIAAMKLARDEGGKEGFDYPEGGKYGYKAERGSGTGAMGTMQVNVTIHNRETDETMYIPDMHYLELEKGEEQELSLIHI